MKNDVSALLDGELDAHQAGRVIAAMRDHDGLRGTWDAYQVVGAALRQEDRLGTALTARVMAELKHDVTVLAPLKPRPAAWHRPLLAMAASLAGAAVVGWVAFSGPQAPAQSVLVTAPRTPPDVALTAVTPVSRREMQDYLVAHQASVAGSQMLGGTRHIRTVSVGKVERP